MLYTVERMEGALAVLEDEAGGLSQRPLASLPPALREGDKLEETERGFLLRPDLRAAELARNRARLEKLRRRNRG